MIRGLKSGQVATQRSVAGSSEGGPKQHSSSDEKPTTDNKNAPTFGDSYEAPEMVRKSTQPPGVQPSTVPGREMEISPELRTQLKQRWVTQADSKPYAWHHNNEFGTASFGVTFDQSAQITNLPAPVKAMLSDTFNLHVVDCANFATLHQTNMATYNAIVEQDGASSALKGSLKVEDLRFANRDCEPALYTTVDPHGGLLDLDGPDNKVPLNLLLQLDIKDVSEAFALTLSEPVDDKEKANLLTRLTGDKFYWEEFQAQFTKSHEVDGAAATAHNFDLFMNAVVRALRTKHGIPVDMALYQKKWQSKSMGRARDMQYLWPIIYDRSMLADTRIAAAYDTRLMPNPFVSSSDLVPMQSKLHDAFTRRPKLASMIADWAQSGRYTTMQRAWKGSQVPDWEEIDIRSYVTNIQTAWLHEIVSMANSGAADEAIDSFIEQKVTQDIVDRRAASAQ